MNSNIIFSRRALRDIAPDLTRNQEDAIIDLYLEASKKFKAKASELEYKLQTVSDALRETTRH